MGTDLGGAASSHHKMALTILPRHTDQRVQLNILLFCDLTGTYDSEQHDSAHLFGVFWWRHLWKSHHHPRPGVIVRNLIWSACQYFRGRTNFPCGFIFAAPT